MPSLGYSTRKYGFEDEKNNEEKKVVEEKQEKPEICDATTKDIQYLVNDLFDELSYVKSIEMNIPPAGISKTLELLSQSSAITDRMEGRWISWSVIKKRDDNGIVLKIMNR